MLEMKHNHRKHLWMKRDGTIECWRVLLENSILRWTCKKSENLRNRKMNKNVTYHQQMGQKYLNFGWTYDKQINPLEKKIGCRSANSY